MQNCAQTVIQTVFHRRAVIVSGAIMLLLTALLAGLPTYQGSAQDNGTPTPTEPPPPLVELNEDVIKRATVFILQTYQGPVGPVISCVGTGTLVSADGLILTNAHVAVTSEECQSDRLVIAITVRIDEPPIPTYTAEVLDSSPGLDLAVVRINGYMDGRVIDPGTLQLPFVELGTPRRWRWTTLSRSSATPLSAVTQWKWHVAQSAGSRRRRARATVPGFARVPRFQVR